MAFAFLMLKARRIHNRKKILQFEKHRARKKQKEKSNIFNKYRYFVINKNQKIKKFCNKIFSFPKGSWMHKLCVNIKINGTLENYLLKSFLGFLAGYFLIYVFFFFFVIILKFSFGIATLICSIFGCILTVGLAFSSNVREIVFLILPQFFSKRGRQALLAYACILALTGPCKNTLINMGIMSESLACGQEQLKQAVKEILELIKKPFVIIKEAIKKIIVVIKKIIKKIKEIFTTIKRIVMAIVKVIKSAFNFLGKIFNICSKKIGTPFQRCTKVFDNSVTDCYAKLGPLFNWLCAIAYVTKYVCYIVKPLDFICMLLDFINDSIIVVIIRKVKKFVRHIRSTFYVRIRFSHSFKFETTASKSIKEVTENILKEMKDRTQKLNDMFSLFSTLTSIFFFVIIIKSIVYRHKFLTNERFENRYITNNFREIDFRRAKMEKETILPLNYRERNKYVNITSFRLVPQERKELFKVFFVLIVSTFELSSHLFIDYSLWWILDQIRFYGKYSNSIEIPQTVSLNVNGKGFVADLFRSVINAFNPLGEAMKIDTIPCLPDPLPPDYDKYIQIGFLLLLCWILAIFEPYGLRFRIHILNYYYPTRARERAVWLFNHILRNRSSFLKFARRSLKRKFLGQKNDKETKITCKEFIRAKINNGFLLFLCKPFLGEDKQDACVLCAKVFRPGDNERPIRCSTPGCPGLYCDICFSDLKNICTICQDPIQYGDLSDIDEEKDSSEDETSAKFKRKIQSKINIDQDDDIPNKKLANTYVAISSPSTDISDASTEYSYSYQYDDENKSEIPTRLPFTDIEKQFIPDYTSFDTFQDDSVKQTIKETKKEKLKPKYFEYSSSETESPDEYNYYKENKRKINNWLLGRTMFKSKKSPIKYDQVPLLDLDQSDDSNTLYYQETSFTQNLKLKPQTDTDNTYTDNSKLRELFPNVLSEEINEHSTNISNINTSRTDSTKVTVRQRKNKSLISSNEYVILQQKPKINCRKYREKIHQYYKSISTVKSERKDDEKNKIISFLTKLY